ncbi:hypothetical protein F5884DRAFT_229854 [Xylogone sp. PMI_703]|nr:hypothetical protein F5884DRAFT_229854 [Xylogone sp. PMI_703]
MRLLKRKENGEFNMIEITGNMVPPYAILSHTWGADDEEVTFKHLMEGTGKSKAGYKKIQFCGEQAAKDELQYFWVDTCCIDKSSSAELQEAIISMFRWYHGAAKCYVYLSDVAIGDCMQTDKFFQQTWKLAFQKSRWFTRGWTLQELIAPASVEFFSKEGKPLGNKRLLEDQIHQITGIAIDALRGTPLSRFSVGERMSWAAKRETKREEDAVYSLLGIFDTHFPYLYGEGRKNAFNRLQKEIKEHLEERPRALLQLLRKNIPSYESYMNENPQRFPGTCEWLVRSEEYQRLLQNDDSMVLWISGNPACGKSVQARFLIEQHQWAQEESSEVILYYFFKQDDVDQSNTVVALRSLLYQLLSQKKELLARIEQDVRNGLKQSYDLYEELYGAFKSALKAPQCGNVFCVIDGVDQILPAEKNVMLDLARLCEPQFRLRQSNNSLKLIFTARPTDAVNTTMEEIKLRIPALRLKSEDKLTIGIIRKDLELYASEEIRLLSDKLSPATQSSLVKKLVEKSDTNFLWAYLVLSAMKHSPSLHETTLEQILNDTPQGMDNLYCMLLRSTNFSYEKRKILQLIVGSKVALTLSELNTAFMIVTKLEDTCTGQIIEEPDIKRTVLMLCGLLVKVVDERIYLVHWTAKRYLLSACFIDTMNPPWEPLEIEECNGLLALCCIRYLISHHVPAFEPLSKPPSCFEYPLLVHASKYWSSYLQKSKSSSQKVLLEKTLSLLDVKSTRFNIWFSHYWRAARPWRSRPANWTTLMVASFLGLEMVVEHLLKGILQESIEIQAERDGREGRTAMDLAAEYGHIEVVNLLIHSSVFNLDFSKVFGHTALHDAARYGHTSVVKLLSGAGASVHSKTTAGEIPLHLAVHHGHTLTVKSLLDLPLSGHGLRDSHGFGWTVIHSAADAGDFETLLVLLGRMGQNEVIEIVNRINEDGYTALHLAAQGRLEPPSVSDSSNISTGLKDTQFTNVIGVLAQPSELIMTLNTRELKAKVPRYSDVIQKLAEQGAIVNAQTPGGLTPLHIAARYGREKLVKILLLAGADVNKRSASGLRAEDYANSKGYRSIVEQLKKVRNDP